MKIKLRCTDSKTMNYTPGYEYRAELGVTVRSPRDGLIGCNVVHGNNTWFFFNKSTVNAEARNGSVVANFEVIE